MKARHRCYVAGAELCASAIPTSYGVLTGKKCRKKPVGRKRERLKMDAVTAAMGKLPGTVGGGVVGVNFLWQGISKDDKLLPEQTAEQMLMVWCRVGPCLCMGSLLAWLI